MRIALLPDTRPEAGLGHLRRCQALVSALEGLGCECVWSNDQGVVPDAIVIDDYRQNERDELFSSLLQHRGCCVVRFVDGIVPARRRCIRDDDGQLLHNSADIVINGAPGAESLPYKLFDGVVALLGPRYLCLDPAIQQLRREGVSPEVRRVVVSLGSNPPAKVLESVLRVIVECASPRTEVLFGTGLQETDAVGAGFIPITAKDSQQFQALTLMALPPLTNIVKELSKADLAITGGGQTMLESVALGVPTIAVCMGDNQLAQVENLFAEGAVEGGISWDSPNLVPSLQGCVQMVVAQTGLRQYMSEAGRRLIDGRGAERVARAIVERVNRKTCNGT